LNLAIGLKNAGDIVPNVLSVIQYSVNEQCVQYSECETFHPLIAVGKPVFHIEYPDSCPSNLVSALCQTTGAAAGSEDFSTVLKNMDLDATVQYCS
jgi:protein-tyrosine phosphatase